MIAFLPNCVLEHHETPRLPLGVLIVAWSKQKHVISSSFPLMADLQLSASSRTPKLEMPHLVSAKVVLPARRVQSQGREIEHPNLQKPSLLA